jgi:prolyl oligopeptidase
MKSTRVPLVRVLSLLLASPAWAGPPGAPGSSGNAAPPPTRTAASNATLERSRKLIAEHWQQVLDDDPVYASFLGDRRANDRWPDPSLTAGAARLERTKAFLARAEAIPEAELPPLDRMNLILFRRELKGQIDDAPFQWDLLPVYQREGIQTTHEVADTVPLASVRDFEEWIGRLERLPAYVDGTIERMREGVRRKMVHPKIITDRVISQVKRLTQAEPTKSPYFAPLNRMGERIPSGERSRLAERARRAIEVGINPAFARFQTFLEKEYLPAGLDRVGCWQMPRGKEMYAHRARRFTTTSMTPDEIHRVGLAEVARIRGEMETIRSKVGFKGSLKEFFEHLRTDPKQSFENPDELIAAYRDLSKRIDPTLVKLFGKLPRMPYGVEPIPLATAPDTTTAYYREPAADGSRAGAFFVNLYQPRSRPKYEMEALALHEAVPGHHFQIALAMELGELPEFRRYGGYTAFIEGWALYAESLGPDLGFCVEPYSRFGQLTYEMWRAIRLVVDTGMHDRGWTRERAIDFFKENAAKSELDIINEIDRYIAWPGQALAYKIGELKIKELRARAEKDLGPRFDVRAFHDTLLADGALPLDLLEERMVEWIRQRRGP